MGFRTFTTLLLAASSLISSTLAAPTSALVEERASGYWVESIQRQGTVAFGTAGYQLFRNVKDFGAKGDGSTDDTDAINAAMSQGNRCASGCSSSTTTPAIVYFPAGTYMVSKPIVQLYYTQMIGDATNLPTLKAMSSFQGMAVIDSDPYADGGVNFWVNQNNFYRQIRNFNIDLTGMPCSAGAGIHWQVAQATSLQNINFNMCQDKSASNKQLGIFMDNGSGGFMSDLTFNGGQYGAFFGNQQFTTRNMTFNNCQTAVFMNWNWVWTLQGVKINNCGVGIDMAPASGTSQTVGSVLFTDSVISNTPIGIRTAYTPSSQFTNGTLIIDNVDMTQNVGTAVQNNGQASILSGNAKVASFVQGKSYTGASGNANRAVQGTATAIQKPKVLLDGNGNVFTRSRPQYETLPASSFISVKSNGAKGDGTTDDTAAIQAVFDKASADSVVYFDHGAYIITDTVKVPKNIKITGEAWPLIMAGGNKNFQDQANPKPVFQVGQPGDQGSVEISDLVFQTQGPQPGAIMMEWNVAQASQGSAALWDTHFRIGGSAGTNQQLAQCAKNPNATHTANPACVGAFLLLHVTSQASGYFENSWAWVADHDLEPAANNQQIDIYNGRGILIESQGPVWGWGTAAEHSVLYNYQLNNASNVFLSAIQTETPYFQGNPDATTPFTVNAKYNDPDFAAFCGANPAPGCAKAWGLRAVASKDVFVYGAGLYSFFDNYDQTCLAGESCQSNMVSLEHSDVTLYGLSTKAATNMVTVNSQSAALQADNPNTFCQTLAFFRSQQ